VNLSAEIILTIISAFGALLTGAVGKMWIWFTAELKECKDDREELHGKITDISLAVGRLEGKLSRDSPAES
jgi:hypothetical protein